MTTQTNLEVANTILAQMGGTGRLSAMLGASSFFGTEDTASFRFKARARNKSNMVKVRLDPSDTYTVEFWTVRGGKATKRSAHSDIYADGLKTLFTDETGLYLSL